MSAVPHFPRGVDATNIVAHHGPAMTRNLDDVVPYNLRLYGYFFGPNLLHLCGGITDQQIWGFCQLAAPIGATSIVYCTVVVMVTVVLTAYRRVIHTFLPTASFRVSTPIEVTLQPRWSRHHSSERHRNLRHSKHLGETCTFTGASLIMQGFCETIKVASDMRVQQHPKRLGLNAKTLLITSA